MECRTARGNALELEDTAWIKLANTMLAKEDPSKKYLLYDSAYRKYKIQTHLMYGVRNRDGGHTRMTGQGVQGSSGPGCWSEGCLACETSTSCTRPISGISYMNVIF